MTYEVMHYEISKDLPNDQCFVMSNSLPLIIPFVG